jgi:hypothetical protein
MLFQRMLCLIIFFVALAAAVAGTLPPPPLPAGAPPDQFSAMRAVETVKVIARSPRLTGSPTFESAREYLLMQMTAMGLTPETQDVTLDGVMVENTLGRLPGTNSNNAILLVAHLDSVSGAPGAADDASGVAEVLETVRALQAGQPLKNTLIVLFTAPEENCCYGARAFATRHRWSQDVRLVLNVDSGGIGGPSILAKTGPQEGWLIRQMATTLPDPLGSSTIEAFGSPATDYSSELLGDGFSGFDFTLSWNKRIHTSQDSLQNIHPASLQHQGEHLLALARHFGDLSLDVPREPNPVYLDILGIFMVTYRLPWAYGFFAFLTLGIGLVFIRAFQRQWFRAKGLLKGALAQVLTLVSVPLILLLVQFALIQPRLAGANGAEMARALTGESFLSNCIRWGAVILTLLAAAFWQLWLCRLEEPLNFGLGGYLFLYLLAAGSIMALPEVSYIVVWPLIFACVALLIHLHTKEKAGQSWRFGRRLGWLTAGLVAILFFVSGILIATLSLNIQMIFLLPIFAGVFAGLMAAPVKESLFSK